MKRSYSRQRGFAAPALLVAVLVGFFASLGIKTDDGTTLAESMGFIDRQVDFAAVEVYEGYTPEECTLAEGGAESGENVCQNE